MAQAMPSTSGPSALGGALERMAAATSPQAAALGLFLALFGAIGAAILIATGGYLGYSLDDAYIHLAVAQRLSEGHYGINPGEITSPSSSVIWPFLLLPAAWTPLYLHMPLVLNIGFGAATAWVYGRFAASIDLPETWTSPQAARVGLACLMVLATNLAGLAYTGLEHNLQVLIAALVATALVEHAKGRALPIWIVALAALGPSVRYEMLAITAAVGLVLMLERRWRMLGMLALGCVVLPAMLAAFLVANGNYPLPNSVMTKLGLGGGGAAASLPLLERLWTWAGGLVGSYLEQSFVAKSTIIVCLGVLAWGWRRVQGRQRQVLGAAFVAGVLHLVAGQFGWFYRYEVYALAFCGIITIAYVMPRSPRTALCGVGIASLAYLEAIGLTPRGAINIYEQQYQMHRLVTQHYTKPFAVNDLGWVSIDLPHGSYVLDLLGLASNEAVRQRDKSPEWLDDVTRRHNAGLAMIYREAFRQIPASWTRVGELRLGSIRVTASYTAVQIYATAVGDTKEIRRALATFGATLPPGVVLAME
jgi:hypothetical protein